MDKLIDKDSFSFADENLNSETPKNSESLSDIGDFVNLEKVVLEGLYEQIQKLEEENGRLRLENDNLKNSKTLDQHAEGMESKDYLTGCRDSRYLGYYKSHEFDPILDIGKLCVVFLDMNDFKAINDTYSHDIGDKYLINMANYLNENFRDDDVIIRRSGDEFIVICKSINTEDEFKEILFERFEKSKKLIIESGTTPPDFAYGVAAYSADDNNDLGRTIGRAEIEMYQDKEKNKLARGLKERVGTDVVE